MFLLKPPHHTTHTILNHHKHTHTSTNTTPNRTLTHTTSQTCTHTPHPHHTHLHHTTTPSNALPPHHQTLTLYSISMPPDTTPDTTPPPNINHTQARGTMSGSTAVHDTIVNQLLSKIDGVNQLNNILVIGENGSVDRNGGVGEMLR